MVKCEKPVTENQKELANKIYTYLYREHRYCTKQEICEHLGVEYNSNWDRKIRDTINVVKKRRAIVATPDRVGYFAPIGKEDLEEVQRQWKYIDKVQTDLEETKQPLIKFYEKFKY